MKNVILILFLICTASHPLLAQNKPDSAKIEKQFTIENCVTEFSMDNSINTQVGYQFWFADSDFIDGRTLKMSVVAPHLATHPPHKHSEDEFFFVVDGRLFIDLEDRTIELGPNQGVTIPRKVEHRPRAPERTTMLMFEGAGVEPTGNN